ncbi:MAG: hypothetical protein WCW26_00410 [Candidatus Buchananbacteria bacterium]
MQKRLLIFLSLALLLNALITGLTPVLAANEVGNSIDTQLLPIKEAYGNPTVDDKTFARTIAEIIKIVLGFLGVIFLVLIIYAGMLWMTSAGNDEKVKTAKDIIIAATIGLAIVLAAYAITFFVVDNLLKATGVSSTGI